MLVALTWAVLTCWSMQRDTEVEYAYLSKVWPEMKETKQSAGWDEGRDM